MEIYNYIFFLELQVRIHRTSRCNTILKFAPRSTVPVKNWNWRAVPYWPLKYFLRSIIFHPTSPRRLSIMTTNFEFTYVKSPAIHECMRTYETVRIVPRLLVSVWRRNFTAKLWIQIPKSRCGRLIGIVHMYIIYIWQIATWVCVLPHYSTS